MPTYIYETTDPAKPIRTFEVKQSVHDEPLHWRRSAPCDLGWLQPSYSRKICWSFGRLGRFTLSPDLGRVAGHFPIVKIFGLLESFRDLVKSLTLRASRPCRPFP